MSDAVRNMVSIPISDFTAGREVPVDVFVKIGLSKYILIAKAGSILDSERLTSYQDRDLSELWVERTTYESRIHDSIQLSLLSMKKANVPLHLKAKILGQAQRTVIEEIRDLGISEASLNHARLVVSSTLQLIDTSNASTDLLHALISSTPDFYNHATAVSTLSVMLAAKMTWERGATFEKIALGGLLHDIGELDLPKSLLRKRYDLMTLEDKNTFQTHTDLGLIRLSQGGLVGEDILAIVREHHENAQGTGYPKSLRGFKIHPLARVVSIAELFVEMTLRGSRGTDLIDPEEALDKICKHVGLTYNREILVALREIIGISAKKLAS